MFERIKIKINNSYGWEEKKIGTKGKLFIDIGSSESTVKKIGPSLSFTRDIGNQYIKDNNKFRQSV